MMRFLIFSVAALSVAGLWHETNSHAAASRGAQAYAAQQYDVAAREFGEAQRLAPSKRGAFNLGTALIAAGQREQGTARLAEAIGDPELRADALFNRGNAALAAKEHEQAIRDYANALRANPRHMAAKRNLEIALRRKRSEQSPDRGDQGQQSNPGQQQQQQNQQQQQGNRNGQPRPQQGQPDLEALLRSVQQQEQEELRRMKGQAAEGRVGW